MISRRQLVLSLAAAIGVAAIGSGDAEAAPRSPARRRTRRRTTRRRVRRRHRRVVRRRVVVGTSMLVVPVTLAVGWELVVDDRVYVVEKIYVVDDVEMVTLVASDGTTIEEPVVREDTPENSQEMEGSELPEDDTTTPNVETEEEV